MTLDKSHSIMAGIIVVLLLALGFGASWWYHSRQAPIPSTPGFQPTAEMKETKQITRVKEQMSVPLVTLKKEEVEKAVPNLPKEITGDPDNKYTTTTEVNPNKGKTNVVTYTNIKTGKTKSVAEVENPPFFGLPKEVFVGGRYGISTEGTKSTLYGGYRGLRVWIFTLSPYVSASYLPQAIQYKVKSFQGEAMFQAEASW